MMKKKKNNKGFSLVELIVVIAIMAVLVGVLAPQFIKYVEQSRQSTDIQNVEQLKTTVEVECTSNQSITAANIVISATAKTATINTTGATITGTSTSADLKSSTWQDVTITYDVTTGAWSTSNAALLDNTATDGKSFKDIFGL